MTAMPAPILRRPAPRHAPAWFGGSMPVARFGIILNLFVPGIVLLWDAWHHMLGVNPVNFAIKTTGLIAVTYLVLSLVVTPLKSITGFTWLVQFRRAIGCYAFYFAAAHLSIYFWWDRGRSLSSTVEEITHHYYLMIGFISLSLMFPLWMTSFNGAIRWLGGTKWKLLHRLAYVAAALGCWHFYLQAKADKSRPDIYFGVLGALLLWRAVAAGVYLVRRPAKPKATTATVGKLRHWGGDLKVVAMFRETDVVRTFRLAMPDGSPIPFTYSAGQFLTLTVPIDGKKVLRSYTIASTPTRDAYIELTVKREENGHASKYLHDMLMTGQSVNINGPAGRFTFDPKSADGITLIAGGVGITPSMSIVRDLTDHGWPGNIDLVFIVRTPADVIFADELKLLASRHPNLHVHYSVTRDAPADWTGLRGHLTAQHLRDRIPDVAGRPAYICGPTAMADSAKAELLAAGVPADRIKIESFTPAAAVNKDVGATPADEMSGAVAAIVTFEQSGKTAQMAAHQTVLEVAEASGVTIDFQCRAGICGTCRCKLLSGQVTMDVRDALSEADEADGYILACQAHALDDISVDA